MPHHDCRRGCWAGYDNLRREFLDLARHSANQRWISPRRLRDCEWRRKIISWKFRRNRSARQHQFGLPAKIWQVGREPPQKYRRAAGPQAVACEHHATQAVVLTPGLMSEHHRLSIGEAEVPWAPTWHAGQTTKARPKPRLNCGSSRFTLPPPDRRQSLSRAPRRHALLRAGSTAALHRSLPSCGGRSGS